MHPDDHVKVARRASQSATFSFSPELQPRPGIQAGWDFHAQRVKLSDFATSAAGPARLWDDGPLPVAVRAGSGNAEEALLKGHLAPAATRRTALR